MALTRSALEIFTLANKLYAGAQVSVYAVDEDTGLKTATLATLYSAATGSTELLNPQSLDSKGRFKQPVYVDAPVIATVESVNFASHDTGILAGFLGVVLADAEAAAQQARTFSQVAERAASRAALAANSLNFTAYFASLGTQADDAADFLTLLGVSAYVQTIFNDADAAAVRSTIGALSSANNAVANANLAQMASGTIKGNIAGATANAADIPLASLLRSYIAGLTLSAAGASAVFGIAAGTAADSTNVSMLTLSSAYTKSTSAWAVGSGNGALDTGAIANSTWYHVYLIQRVDTGVVDVIVSTSASAPTLPANYTLYRRIGAMKTDGSAQWLKFSQFGDEFLWDVMAADVAVTNLGTTGTLFTLTVPTGVKVNALFRASFKNAAVDVGGFISSPDESDQTVSVAAGKSHFVVSVAGKYVANAFDIRTNTSAQVRGVSDTANSTLNISTYGWIDRRGKDS